jgi:DNA-binding XRE family transcriptional regulator
LAGLPVDRINSSVRADSKLRRRETGRRPEGASHPRKPLGWGRREGPGQPGRREAQAGLGQRIRAMRRAKRLPQDVLARRCGISPAALGEIERGHKNFRLMTVLLIAQGLETTVADLFAGIA